METSEPGNGLELLAEGIFMESPRWHRDAVWFSDIGAGTVKRVTLDRRKHVAFFDICGASGLGLMGSADVLVASLLT